MERSANSKDPCSQRATLGSARHPVQYASDGRGTSEAAVPDGAQEIETRLVVWDLVRRLTPDQQEVVRLKFAGGLTTAQIALALRKSEPAVKMLLSRALHSLREDLGKEVSING